MSALFALFLPLMAVIGMLYLFLEVSDFITGVKDQLL